MLKIIKNWNNVIRGKMDIKNSGLDYIRDKQMNWYGNMQRMNEESLPRDILEWCPLGRKKEDLKFVNAGSNSWNEEEGN